MAGIGVITNPRSRRNQRDPGLARELGYILGERGSFEMPPDRGALLETARRFREREIDVLCVNGGDGTTHTALGALMAVYGDAPLPRIMLLRGGTMNTVASGMGIRGAPAALLEYLLSRYHEGVPLGTTRRMAMKIDGDKYGFIFGNGVLAHFLEAYYATGSPSPLRAATTLARAVGSGVINGPFFRTMTRPWVGEVELDGVTWARRPWLAIAAGTVDDIGIGFRPFYRGPHHLDCFHAMGLDMSGWEVAKELPRIYRAQPMKHERVEDHPGRRMRIRSEQPIPYMIDGDFHRGGTEVTVEVGPTVEFIIPDAMTATTRPTNRLW